MNLISQGNKTSMIWCKSGLWHLEGYIFWKTDFKAKVCIQNVYQGLILVKWKRRKQNSPEGEAELPYRTESLIQPHWGDQKLK